MDELELQSRIRLSLGKRIDCVLFRNSVGTADTHNGHKVAYGLGKGSPDLVGFVRPSGRFIGLEIKTAVGRPSKEQLQWQQLINLGGGFARIVRSIEEANVAVDEAIRTAIK